MSALEVILKHKFIAEILQNNFSFGWMSASPNYGVDTVCDIGDIMNDE